MVEGKADFLMKGKLDTAILLKAVVNKECGLGQGRTMSHFTMFQVPGYHKLMVPVTAAWSPIPPWSRRRTSS